MYQNLVICLNTGYLTSGEAVFSNVLAVGNNRSTDVLHVHTQLMGPSRVWVKFHQCVPRKRFGDLVKRDRFTRLSTRRADHHFFANAVVDAHMRSNVIGFKFRNASYNRPVFFLNRTLFELTAEFLVNLIVFGNQNDSGGVAIESMDDAGTVASADVAKLVKVELQSGR